MVLPLPSSPWQTWHWTERAVAASQPEIDLAGSGRAFGLALDVAFVGGHLLGQGEGCRECGEDAEER